MTAPAPVDETKAPERLPEWLEPGTTWTANRGSSHGEFTFRLLSRAHNDGGWARGCDQWQILGAYERIAPTHQHFTRPPDNITLAEVNWSSVTALRSPPATVPACDAHPVGSFRYALTTTNSKHGDGVLVQGWVIGNSSASDVAVLEFRDAARTVCSVRRDSLSEKPLWMCLGCGATCGDHPDQCGLCGTVRGYPGNLPIARGSNGFGSSSDAKPKPDPYASHPSPSPHWLHEQNRIAAAKLDSARADLDKPMREKRYGRLGELDRYGAKLSSVGWETED